MSRRLAALLVVLAGIAFAPLPGQPAAASCAAPSLDVERGAVLEIGAPTTVEGRYFSDGCRDSMGCTSTFGCSSCEYDDPEPTPTQDIELTLVQGGRSWSLGTVDAAAGDPFGTASWEVVIPAQARPGHARLEAGDAQPVQIRLR